MLQSKLFTKTSKVAPHDAEAANARLLLRGGFIYKEMAGVYDYLPLGLRVLKNIEKIIREEINAIGGQEVLMTTLQDREIWEKSGRWNDTVVDNWFKSKLAGGGEVGIANTHEETITNILTRFVSSYKDLPIYVYQFQTKFRNELRAKSGLLRGREFLMNDLYSFDQTEEEFKTFYEKCAGAYMRIFERVGLGAITYRTVAGGGSFTANLTDEFQTLCEAGEDTIYIDEEKRLAINKEVYTDENIAKFGLNKSKLVQKKSIEVGNIFPYGTKYPDIFGLKIQDKNGEEKSVFMGAYGVGLGRLMGAIVETHNDNRGIIWPERVAPFRVQILRLQTTTPHQSKHGAGQAYKLQAQINKAALKLYNDLLKCGVEVLYDDRENASAGEKFSDADLIGCPWRVVVSEKSLAAGGVEVKRRDSKVVKIMKSTSVLKMLTK